MANSLTANEYNPEKLSAEFLKIYGENKNEIQIFSSPARINIIGEHIDFNGGKVFPASINRCLYIAIRKRNDSKIIYNDVRFPGTFEFSTDENFSFKKENDYANYLNQTTK